MVTFVSWLHGNHVTILRRPAQVPYPNAYASAESIAAATPELKKAKYLFNCSQRAHANYMENMPMILVSLLTAGVDYPLAATALGVTWIGFRGVYWWGYMRPEATKGEKRSAGGLMWVAQLGLLGLMGKTAWDIVKS
jgi:glutathione S-transferase